MCITMMMDESLIHIVLFLFPQKVSEIFSIYNNASVKPYLHAMIEP